jgi:hypothetical protein
MLVMLVAALAVMTLSTALLAREAWLSDRRKSAVGWLIASVPFGLTTTVAAWFVLAKPTLLSWTPPTGFGSNWDCPNENVPPYAARVCVRH